ncbi:MAG: hypothetical protein WA918_05875 [Erythrobacter sp.]
MAIFHLTIFLSGAPNSFAAIYGFEILLENGRMLVDLFFVISGLILARAIWTKEECAVALPSGSFAWARFSRLWPLHCVVLCFTAFMLRSDADTNAYNFLMSLGLLHVFLPDIDVLNPPV